MRSKRRCPGVCGIQKNLSVAYQKPPIQLSKALAERETLLKELKSSRTDRNIRQALHLAVILNGESCKAFPEFVELNKELYKTAAGTEVIPPPANFQQSPDGNMHSSFTADLSKRPDYAEELSKFEKSMQYSYCLEEKYYPDRNEIINHYKTSANTALKNNYWATAAGYQLLAHKLSGETGPVFLLSGDRAFTSDAQATYQSSLKEIFTSLDAFRKGALSYWGDYAVDIENSNFYDNAKDFRENVGAHRFGLLSDNIKPETIHAAAKKFKSPRISLKIGKIDFSSMEETITADTEVKYVEQRKQEKVCGRNSQCYKDWLNKIENQKAHLNSMRKENQRATSQSTYIANQRSVKTFDDQGRKTNDHYTQRMEGTLKNGSAVHSDSTIQGLEERLRLMQLQDPSLNPETKVSEWKDTHWIKTEIQKWKGPVKVNYELYVDGVLSETFQKTHPAEDLIGFNFTRSVGKPSTGESWNYFKDKKGAEEIARKGLLNAKHLQAPIEEMYDNWITTKIKADFSNHTNNGKWNETAEDEEMNWRIALLSSNSDVIDSALIPWLTRFNNYTSCNNADSIKRHRKIKESFESDFW